MAELMFRSIRADVAEGTWERWRRRSLEVVSGLPSPNVAVFVVDDPARPGSLVSCGAGVIATRLPNPFHTDSRAGYVQWMSTDAAFRRRGLARAVLSAVLAWFDERGVDNVELHATADGVPLYRSEGFWEGSSGLAMRRRPWDPPPP